MYIYPTFFWSPERVGPTGLDSQLLFGEGTVEQVLHRHQQHPLNRWLLISFLQRSAAPPEELAINQLLAEISSTP
jgi:hypothetical protein